MLRFTYKSAKEEDLPFTINVFNSKNQGKTNVTLELELTEECSLCFSKLESIQVYINVDSRDYQVLKCGKSDSTEYDDDNQKLIW